MDRPGGSPSRLPAWSPPRVTFAEYLRQCWNELRKVVWPDGRAVRTNAGVMLVIMIVVIAGVGTFELAAGWVTGP